MVRIETQLVHEASPPEESTGSIVPPIYSTSTFVQSKLGKHKGFEYTRSGNPTRAALERAMAILEGGTNAWAFASGMAAIDTALHLLKKGDHVVVAEETYGGTRRILDHAYAQFGVDVTYVPGPEVAAWEDAATDRTRLFFLETPSNPLVRVTDLRAVSRVAKTRGIWVGVDNTFASPYLQRPLEHGADFVVHSATKYLGGHSDLLAGVIVTNRKELVERFGFYQNACGGVCSPWDAWLVLRGLKTLHLRMEATCKNAAALARFLSEHRKVSRVHYPGLKDHPQHALARRQMRRPGGMFSFEIDGGIRSARRVLRPMGSITLAESLGSVETLLSHPWTMSHVSVPEPARRRLGITPGLVRVSTGIENVEDLKADFGRLLRAG